MEAVWLTGTIPEILSSIIISSPEEDMELFAIAELSARSFFKCHSEGYITPLSGKLDCSKSLSAAINILCVFYLATSTYFNIIQKTLLLIWDPFLSVASRKILSELDAPSVLMLPDVSVTLPWHLAVTNPLTY
uniref:Uncharacterized protein n=1 Tax=Glossina pallidipes TaxID=7398 RepID=A0A1A9ZBE2_GLOPL